MRRWTAVPSHTAVNEEIERFSLPFKFSIKKLSNLGCFLLGHQQGGLVFSSSQFLYPSLFYPNRGCVDKLGSAGAGGNTLAAEGGDGKGQRVRERGETRKKAERGRRQREPGHL